jgi:hypothetical protein
MGDSLRFVGIPRLSMYILVAHTGEINEVFGQHVEER